MEKFNLKPDTKIKNAIHYCGKYNRVIKILENEPELIYIGCTTYTKEQAIEAITNNYKDPEERDGYISKVKECFNN